MADQPFYLLEFRRVVILIWPDLEQALVVNPMRSATLLTLAELEEAARLARERRAERG